MPPLGSKKGLKGSSKSKSHYDTDDDDFEFGGSSYAKLVTKKKKRKQKKKSHRAQEPMSKQPTIEDAHDTSSEGEAVRKVSKSKKYHAAKVL